MGCSPLSLLCIKLFIRHTGNQGEQRNEGKHSRQRKASDPDCERAEHLKAGVVRLPQAGMAFIEALTGDLKNERIDSGIYRW
jgi:hypothetical protein